MPSFPAGRGAVVRLVRILFIESMRSRWCLAAASPRIAPPAALARPSLLIANHLTAFDVPVILYALSRSDRDHVAVAMSGQLLGGWRRGQSASVTAWSPRSLRSRIGW